MLEKEMEDLIAEYPEEFFPRHKLKLLGRQRTFQESGRYDLLFTDEFGTQILMELKALPAKYEHATQLARYKDALRGKSTSYVLMWLVAPSIPKTVRDFLDQVGIEYTEIHEAEFRKVATQHGYNFASESLLKPTPSISEGKKMNIVEQSPKRTPKMRGSASWFFNTDESEAEGRGAYLKMLAHSCIALWAFKGTRDPERDLLRAVAGERVFFYLNKVGFIATGLFSEELPRVDDSIFQPGTPRAYSRSVSNLIVVSNDKALKYAEIKSMGANLVCQNPFYKIPNGEVADKMFEELESRSRC